MRKTVQTSARLVSEFHPAGLARWQPLGISGVLGQQRTSARDDEVNRRLFRTFSKCRAVAELSTPSSLVQDIPVQRNEPVQRAKELPRLCPGCGAPSQTVDSDAAGYYGSRRADRGSYRQENHQHEAEILQTAMQSGAFSSKMPPEIGQTPQMHITPICDRCHYLQHQSRGTSIMHPSMRSIQDIIEDSPHKHNHIYHILDAADFPMSLIPNLQSALKLPRLRTQNRRSKTVRYIRGRVAEVSFIITRSDLLAPQKEQVDRLVPYLREVLRDALGKSGHNVRLGNVRCVSAQRGWWTKTVKEEIWDRGGAGWMVGKVNVGKSALYEVVFPKGRGHEDTDVKRIRQAEQKAIQEQQPSWEQTVTEDHTDIEEQPLSPDGKTVEPDDVGTKVDRVLDSLFVDSPGEMGEAQNIAVVHPSNPAPHSRLRHDGDGFEHAALNDTDAVEEKVEFEPFQETELEIEEYQVDQTTTEQFFDEDENASLLPAAQPETQYPRMPLVSALPGTTAAPIRIPFGNGKGELIDLPGIHRSSFDTHIKPEHCKSLVMKARVVPEQHVLKPGQSILIGGTIRITPKTEDLIFLAYAFVPLEAHVTSHLKAAAIQTGVSEDGESYAGTVESIATDAAKQHIRSAGTFELKWDVTKRRAGPLTDKAAGKQKAANLPFTVYSADLLIEGVGWVELACQVRNRRGSFLTDSASDAFGKEAGKKGMFPEVEVWSPEGKFVGMRQPMNAWLLGGPKKVPKHERHMRPRQSMSYHRRKAGGGATKARVLVEE